MSYFNSIKVRLKLKLGTGIVGDVIFQFHKGTIKTVVAETQDSFGLRFQFHKGTIKTF